MGFRGVVRLKMVSAGGPGRWSFASRIRRGSACSPSAQRLVAERQTPVAGRREGRGAALAHARGVTDPDDGWPGGAVPAGPPTPRRAFKRCADPSGPNAGTVTTGVCPFQPLVVRHPLNLQGLLLLTGNQVQLGRTFGNLAEGRLCREFHWVSRAALRLRRAAPPLQSRPHSVRIRPRLREIRPCRARLMQFRMVQSCAMP